MRIYKNNLMATTLKLYLVILISKDIFGGKDQVLLLKISQKVCQSKTFHWSLLLKIKMVTINVYNFIFSQLWAVATQREFSPYTRSMRPNDEWL